MTAPWATCPRCHTPLYPRLARRTDEGWEHAACLTCADCGTFIEGPRRRGYCRTCYDRRRRAERLPEVEAVKTREKAPCIRCGVMSTRHPCRDCRAVIADLGEMDRWVA